MAPLTPGFWRRARRLFRWFRICLLSLVLFGTALLLWCNVVGLPSWMTRTAEAQLRQNGLNLEFDRLRLSGIRKVLATGVRLTGASPQSPVQAFSAPAAELLLDWSDVLAPRVRGVLVQDGTATIPLSTNSPAETLSISNIHTEALLSASHVLDLKSFGATILDTRLAGFASITNINRVPKTSKSKGSQDWERWRATLQSIVPVWQQLSFAEAPRLMISLRGDASDPGSFRVLLRAQAARASSEWGELQGLSIASALQPLGSNYSANFRLELGSLNSALIASHDLALQGESVWSRGMDRLVTNWISGRCLELRADAFSLEKIAARIDSSQPAPSEAIQSTVRIESSQASLYQHRLISNRFEADLSHPLPFPSPARALNQIRNSTNFAAHENSARPHNEFLGKWLWSTHQLIAAKFLAENVSLTGELLPVPNAEPASPSALAGFLSSHQAPWKLALSNILAENINVGSLHAHGAWMPPLLEVSSLRASLYRGGLQASGNIDFDSGQGTLLGASAFDYHKLAVLLDRPVQRWLDQFTWASPPKLDFSSSFRLPPARGSFQETIRGVAASLQAQGEFSGAGAFRDIPFDHAGSTFTYSNFVWNLPDLQMKGPHGSAAVRYAGNVTNGTFLGALESRLDPGAAQNLFPTNQQLAFKLLRFSIPPLLRGTLSGDWDDLQTLQFDGEFAATNLFFKGEPISTVSTRLFYTNLTIECRDIIATRGPEKVTAPYARVDIPGEYMFVTNGLSSVNPWWAMSLVDEEVYDAIDPYRFAQIPLVKINGNVPLRHWSKADIHFNVTGTNFTYWRFNLPTLQGDVYWKADHISFSNVVAGFYGGNADWSGHFYINDHHSADFSFTSDFRDSDLKSLLADLTPGAGQMEGRVDGTLTITSANSDDLNSWNGFGHAKISDGFLWRVPVFGVFLKMVDAVVPGASLAGVTAAEGRFGITNTVVHTRDLQVKAPAFRLNYVGQVDLEGNLDAKVEAEILRDFWLLGRVFSTVLWPVSKAFEARVSGTVQEPKTSLRHFPRLQRSTNKPATKSADPVPDQSIPER